MVPQERLKLNSNWAILIRLSTCNAVSISWTGSAGMEGQSLHCSSSHSSNHCQIPSTTSAHIVLPSHYHHTLSPAHDDFQQVEIFAHKNKWQNALPSSTVAILQPLLCLFPSSEALTVTAVWCWIHVPTEHMLANSMQKPFQQEQNTEPYYLNCPHMYIHLDCFCLFLCLLMNISFT